MDKSTWLERLAKRDSTIVDEIYGCLAISLTERLKRKWSHFDPHLADEFFGEALFRLYNNADDIHRVFQVSTPAGPAAYIYGYLWLKMDALAKDYYQKQNSIKSQRISARNLGDADDTLPCREDDDASAESQNVREQDRDFLQLLTEKEQKTLAAWSRCKNAREVAEQLGAKPATIRKRMSRLGEKLVALGVQMGIDEETVRRRVTSLLSYHHEVPGDPFPRR